MQTFLGFFLIILASVLLCVKLDKRRERRWERHRKLKLWVKSVRYYRPDDTDCFKRA